MAKKVVVIGAGMAGLGVAFKLCQEGCDVEIIEKEPFPGGIGASIRKGNFIFDFGPHGYAAVEQELLEFLKELMGDEAVETFKSVKISFRGHLCQYPLQALDLVRNISPFTSSLVILDYLHSALRQKIRHEPDRNMQDWLVHRFGRTIYDLFFGPYTQKVWGVHPSKLDALFPQHRIPHTSLLRVILKSFRRGESVAEKDEHRYCPLLIRGYYPASGSGVVPDELCRRIEKAGGTIHLGTRVEAVDLSAKDSAVVTVVTGSGRRDIRCDYVVSTAPLNEFLRMVHPTPPTKVMDAGRQLKFRSIRVIGLGLRRSGTMPAQSIYYTDKSFNRLSDLINYGGHKMAPPGKSALTVELTCDKGDRLWAAEDEDIISEVIGDLEEEGIITTNDVEETLSLKVEHAYPIYLKGFARHMKTIADFLAHYSHIYTTGRQGTFQYVDMDVAFDMGRVVGRRLAAGLPKEVHDFPLEVPYF